MRTRFPAALRKPARKRLGQRHGFGSFENGHAFARMILSENRFPLFGIMR